MTLSCAAIRAVSVFAALAVAAAGIWFVLRPDHLTHLTAHFASAVGVYPGSDVRVLGVKVGTITAVTPQGGTVRVRMTVDAVRKVPAGARAVVVAPSLVSDRYVQLTPVYRGGPALADGADIPLARTASPVELDAIYQSLNNLAVALGPQGANRDGALSRLFDVGAANLRGNGTKINQSIDALDRAVSTLSAGRGDLFGSVRNLRKFVSTLARGDQQVRQFNTNLASVSAQLAGERTALAAALKNLAAALGQVTTFVRNNQALIKTNVAGLARVTSTLVHQRDALAEFLDVAPTALSNLSDAYDPRSGTLDTRNNFNQLGDPAYVCALLMSLPEQSAIAPVVGRCQQAAALSGAFSQALGAALHALGVDSVPGLQSGSAGSAGPPGQSAGGQPAEGDLPTIPGVRSPASAGGLPTIPGLGGAVGTAGGVTSGLTDALNNLDSLLGAGR
ncbi:MAG TPA: MCE family protein [Mycobacteriales bacterium]|nr:MCE family protein [Mycobacteriales bacterium]